MELDTLFEEVNVTPEGAAAAVEALDVAGTASGVAAAGSAHEKSDATHRPCDSSVSTAPPAAASLPAAAAAAADMPAPPPPAAAAVPMERTPTTGAAGRGQRGGGPMRHRGRSRSSPIASRNTLKQLRTHKEAAVIGEPLHVKIISLSDISDSGIEYDDQDMELPITGIDTTFPRLKNRRRAILADNSAWMRAVLYVDIPYHVGESVRLTNYGLRLMRVVVHRQTCVQFNIPIEIPNVILQEAQNKLDVKYYPYTSLKSLKEKPRFCRGSVDRARISRITDKRNADDGKMTDVTELYLDDGSARMYVSCWKKTALLPFNLHQEITIHDVIGKYINFHQEMILNVNFLDEITLGAILPEVVLGKVESLNASSKGSAFIYLIVVDDTDQWYGDVPVALFQEACEMHDKSLTEMQKLMPIYVRLVMAVNDTDKVTSVTRLLEKP